MAFGLVGIVSIYSHLFLVVIKDKEQVGTLPLKNQNVPIYRISEVDLIPFDNKIKSIDELNEKMMSYAYGMKKTLEMNDFYFCQH